jgi:chemotaxis protein histidine kinase CheA
VRAEIAGYASETAMNNATKEAAARRAAEDRLAKARPKLDAAEASLAKAQQRVRDLETQLAEARSDIRQSSVSAKASSKRAEVESSEVEAAKAAESKAEAEAKVANEREAQEEEAAHASKKSAAVASKKEAELKLAARDALRKQRPRLDIGDFVIFNALRHCPYQVSLSLGFGFVGLSSILDGVSFFQGFFIILCAATVGACICAETLAFGGDRDIVAASAGAAEASVVIAIACYYGLEGFQIVVGALLGLVLAHSTCGSLIAYSPANVLVEFVICAVAVLIGSLAMFFGDRNAQAVVGPFVGGFLSATCAVYLVASVVSSHALKLNFIDFMEALLTGRGRAITRFGLEGKQAAGILVLGASIWVAVFAFGISRYFCQCPRIGGTLEERERRGKRKSKSDRTDPLLPQNRSGRSGEDRTPRRYDVEAVPSGRSEGRGSGRSQDEPRYHRSPSIRWSPADEKRIGLTEQRRIYGMG